MQEISDTNSHTGLPKWRLGLSGRATFLIIAIVFAALVASTICLYLILSASLRPELDASMSKLSTASAGRVGNWLRGKIDLTQVAAQEIGSSNGLASPERVFNLPVLRETFPIQYIGRSDGTFAQVPFEQMAAGYDPRQRGWYKGAVDANGPYMTDPYLRAGTNILAITTAVPVRNSAGDLQGVVGTNIDLAALNFLLSNTESNSHAYSYLVSGAGRILFHPRAEFIGKSISDLISGPLPRIETKLADTMEGGRPTLTVFSRIPRLSPSTDWYVALSWDKDEAFTPLNNLTKTLIAVSAVTLLLLALAVRRLMIVTVAHPLNRLVNALQRMAGGEIGAEIVEGRRSDEIGLVARAVEGIRTLVARKAVEQAEMRRVADEAAAAERRHTMITLADGFERAVGSIVGSVSSSATQLQATAETMTATASQTAGRSVSVAAAAEQAATNVGTVAAAAEELGTSVQEIARQVAGSADLAQEAVVEADQTAQLVQDLSEAVSQIDNVVSMIAKIAGQTNLLALNATIEAARAGEAGRGFAVVAAEVKTLASQTARATEEITGHIHRIQDSTGHAVEAIGGISTRIREINDVASSIAAAVEQQGAATAEIVRNVAQAATGASEVTGNITGVAEAAEETGSAASQVLTSATELSRQSVYLSDEVKNFLSTIRSA